MGLIDFVNYILTPFELEIMSLSNLAGYISSCTDWWQLLNPSCFLSIAITILFTMGVYFIVFVIPFRIFKRFIKCPDKKGKR